MVVNVQVEDNDDGAADKWNQLKEIVKTAVYQFDESMISNFFVIFEGKWFLLYLDLSLKTLKIELFERKVLNAICNQL